MNRIRANMLCNMYDVINIYLFTFTPSLTYAQTTHKDINKKFTHNEQKHYRKM